MNEDLDNNIINQFRAGDKEAAFRLLIESFKQPLYQHIRRMVQSHEDTDDILQDTFLKAWIGLPNFRGDSKLYSWLYRIATNESLNFIGKRIRRSTVSLNTVSNQPGNDQSGPSGKQVNELLNKAMDILPTKQRQVFVMRYFDELKYDEIAEITGTSIGALKSSYHIAVKKIEDFLRIRSNL